VKLRPLLATLCLALSAGFASAHHSFAMFDNDHQILLSGKVTEFTWQNPHVYIHLEAKDARGKTSVWTIECANPGILNRTGWKFNMIKKGDLKYNAVLEEGDIIFMPINPLAAVGRTIQNLLSPVQPVITATQTPARVGTIGTGY
jgi:hypothetical protein